MAPVENFVPVAEVINAIDRFDGKKDNRLEVSEFTTVKSEPFISLIPMGPHFYVVYRHTDGKLYVADGVNKFHFETPARKRILKDFLKEPAAASAPFAGNAAARHSGTAAVLIALAFRNSYRCNRAPTVLKAPRSLIVPLTKIMHKYDSEIDTSPVVAPFGNMIADVCQYCGRQYRLRERRGFLLHISNHGRKGDKVVPLAPSSIPNKGSNSVGKHKSS